MKLKQLLSYIISTGTVQPNTELEISGIAIDSRSVERGYLFIAMRGTQVDGHTFISKAIEKGAAAIVCEKLPETLLPGITYIRVADSEEAAGPLASAFWGEPSKKLTLVGVTGTNGKTTIATLLYRMFKAFGYKVGLLSTVCNYIDDTPLPADHTTPDAISLNALLAQMVEAGCKYAFMEVSSHSIAQKRIGGLSFAGGIFTNLTRDHLDYHKTFENYLTCKKAFFDNLPANSFALTNDDDKNGKVMLQNTLAKSYTYSLKTMSDFRGRILEMHFNGMLLQFNQKEFAASFIGRFNVSNLLAVYGAACLLGRSAEEVLTVLSTLHPVSGRLETIHSPEGVTAVVDYAHTPDAIKNVLSTLNDILNKKGSIITVVGAGGNRDKGKRPLMAQEAVRGSNRVIITSDNPRFEEPQDIINDMLAGLTDEERRSVISIVDRKEAMRTACMMAQRGDVVLVAGKGHEDYQDVKGVKHHFDDKEVLKELFNI